MSLRILLWRGAVALTVGSMSTVWSRASHAEETYPNRLVKFVVPARLGSSGDTPAPLIAREFEVATGQLRAIAMTSGRRSPQFPDLEEIAETYPGFEVVAYLSVMVRKEIPGANRRRLNALINDILHKPELRRRPLELRPTPVSVDWDLERCAKLLREQREEWSSHIKLANIEPQ
jgi:tripartite-type tricarboxylate transporter receptor subunit TctC